jgi:hypothetical protein
MSQYYSNSVGDAVKFAVAFSLRYQGVTSDDVNITQESSVGRRRLLASGISLIYTIAAADTDYSTLHSTLISSTNSSLFTTIIQQQSKLSSIVALVPVIKNLSPTPAPTAKPTMRPTSAIADGAIAGVVVAVVVAAGLLLSCFLYFRVLSRRKTSEIYSKSGTSYSV